MGFARAIALGWGGLCLLALHLAPAAAQSADILIERAIAKQGGADRLRSLGDIRLDIKFTARSAKDSIEGEMFELYRAPNQLAMVLRSGVKPDVVKVFDGAAGKFMRRNLTDPSQERVYDMGPGDLDQMRDALSRARLLILTNLLVPNSRLELLKSSLRGYEIRWRGPSGELMHVELDGLYQLKKASFGADKSSRASFTEFRVFEGVTLPTEITAIEPGGEKGDQTIEIALRRVEFLGPGKIPDELFVDPKRVAEFFR